MISAELLRSATTEELREAASMLDGSAGNPFKAAVESERILDLAAAALSLIAEGREDGTFRRAAAVIEAAWGQNGILTALAGGSP